MHSSTTAVKSGSRSPFHQPPSPMRAMSSFVVLTLWAHAAYVVMLPIDQASTLSSRPRQCVPWFFGMYAPLGLNTCAFFR